MSERIKELAERAGYKHPDAVGMCEDYSYFDHEKFAELIIADCYSVIIKSQRGHFNPATSWDAVKQHFGVEE